MIRTNCLGYNIRSPQFHHGNISCCC